MQTQRHQPGGENKPGCFKIDGAGGGGEEAILTSKAKVTWHVIHAGVTHAKHQRNLEARRMGEIMS